MPDWELVTWLDPGELEDVEYAGYWNDEEAERRKEWYVGDGDFSRMARYLDESGLAADLEHAVSELRRDGRGIGGRGVDVAAGTLWAAPRLLAAGAEHVVCVELSRHRLVQLGPQVLEHYGVRPEQVTLALGSFYDLRIPDGTLDFAFLCQALHHADRPEALLAELRRVLRPGGTAVVVGEHVLGARHYATAAARTAVAALPRELQRRVLGRVLEPSSHPLVLPPDPVMGDHFYTPRQYRELFVQSGFSARAIRRPGSPMQGFLATRPAR